MSIRPLTSSGLPTILLHLQSLMASGIAPFSTALLVRHGILCTSHSLVMTDYYEISGELSDAALNALRSHPDVESISEDGIMFTQATVTQ